MGGACNDCLLSAFLFRQGRELAYMPVVHHVGHPAVAGHAAEMGDWVWSSSDRRVRAYLDLHSRV